MLSTTIIPVIPAAKLCAATIHLDSEDLHTGMLHTRSLLGLPSLENFLICMLHVTI